MAAAVPARFCRHVHELENPETYRLALTPRTPEEIAAAAASEDERAAAVATLQQVVRGWDITALDLDLGASRPSLHVVDGGLLERLHGLDSLDRFLSQGDVRFPLATVAEGGTTGQDPLPSWATEPATGDLEVPRVQSFRAQELLTNNRTVVVSALDKRAGGELSDFTATVASAFRTPVQVNCYLSTGLSPGFGAHWDDHDVLIVQVNGSKYWEVRTPTQLAPLREVCESDDFGDVVWSGVLEPGLALYIPRGWAHEVRGFDGSLSFHLTVSIRRPTGLDILERAITEPRRLAALDRPWENTVATGLINDLTVDHALASWRRDIAQPSANGLSGVWNAINQSYEGHDVQAILPGGAVFATTERSNVPPVDGSLCLAANRRTFRVEPDVVPLTTTLMRGGWHAGSDLVIGDGCGTAGCVAGALSDLGALGVIRLRPTEP